MHTMARLTIPQVEQLEHDLIGSDMDLIEQLVEHRKRSGMDIQQVADKMGVDRSVVSRFESISSFSAKNHTMRTVRRYAHAIGAYVVHIVVAGDPAEYKPYSDVVKRKIMESRNSSGIDA